MYSFIYRTITYVSMRFEIFDPGFMDLFNSNIDDSNTSRPTYL